jgi:hypothetical protein
MKYIITYSMDSNKYINDWTEEVYTDKDKAEQTAIELLYCGFYVRLDESEE